MFAEVDTIGNSPLDKRLKAYFITWKEFIEDLDKKGEWLGGLAPVALGWKVADRAAFNKLLVTLSDGSEQLHAGTVNDRKIASIVVPKPLAGDIHIIELMERRPGSTDPTGLDHVDFLLPDTVEAAAAQLDKSGIPYKKEANDTHAWLSIRFGEDGKQEAKIKEGTVLDICMTELAMANEAIIKNALAE